MVRKFQFTFQKLFQYTEFVAFFMDFKSDFYGSNS